MKAVTWVPGENTEFDQLFDSLREQQYQNQEHRLWKNYSKESFKFAVALTICFNDNGDPEMCSSIASRDCWPNGAYRILNRLWKHSNKISYPRVMSESFGKTTQSQIEWLETNTSYQLYFISRQTDNWEEWCINNFRDRFSLAFKTDNYKYLTCPNECDSTCWQNIIYHGDESLLTRWKRRQ